MKISNEQTSSPNFLDANSHTVAQPGAWGETATLTQTETGQPGTVKTRFDDANSVAVDLASDWNSIKNVSVTSEEGANVTLDKFVYVNVELGGQDDSQVTISNAKRGDISTGEGNDTITITAFTNGPGWSNHFDVNAGEGDNVINISGSQGHTSVDIVTGSGNDTITLQGDFANIDIQSTGGSNTFDLSGASFSSATIEGGNDGSVFNLGNNVDGVTLVGGSGSDVLQLSLTSEQMTDSVRDELYAFSQSEGDTFQFTALGNLHTTYFNGLSLFVDGQLVDIDSLMPVPDPSIEVSVGYEAETVRLDDALAANPDQPISVSTGASGIVLTSMGKMDGDDGEDYSVWRLRNGSDEEIYVTLESVDGSFTETYLLPPNSDTFVASTSHAGSATHKMIFEDGSSTTKAASSDQFSYGQMVETEEQVLTVQGTTEGVDVGATVDITVTDSSGNSLQFTSEVNEDGTFTIALDDLTGLVSGDLTIEASTFGPDNALISGSVVFAGYEAPEVQPEPSVEVPEIVSVEVSEETTYGKPELLQEGRNLNNHNLNGGHNDHEIAVKNINSSSINLGNGDDVLVIRGNGNNSNINLGDGDNTIVLQGNSYKNMSINAGNGNDVLYLPGTEGDYHLNALNNNNGVLSGFIGTNGAGNQGITINNFDLIVFEDGTSLGNGHEPALGVVTVTTIVGEATPEHEIEIYADGVLLGTTTADGNGNWTFGYNNDSDISDLAFTAVAIDADGNRSDMSDVFILNGVDVDEPEVGADPMPVLAVNISDLETETVELFSTDFDAINDPNWADGVNTVGYITTGLQFVSEADGWLPVEDGGVIEIRAIENSASGQQHIELNSSDIAWAHAPGIMREVSTDAGSEYTLDFQYAARPGYGPDVNVFEVVVDGAVVGTFSADGTGSTSAQWQSGSVTFTGNGEPQTIVLREASENDQDLGRGMLIDDIALAVTSQRVDIQLQTEAAEGAELTYSITGLPEGAGLFNADGVIVASEPGVWILTAAQAEGLYMSVPMGTSGEFDIEVTVIATTEQGSQNATETLAWSTGEDIVEATSIVVMNLSSHAGYHNTYGFYTKDDNGNPVAGEIIWADVKQSIGQSVTLEGYGEDDVGFFLISNGGNRNDYEDGDVVEFQQVGGNWVAGTEVNGQFQAFTSDSAGGTYFSDASLNPGGVVKMQDTDEAGNQNWEDMGVFGDSDFNDFNVQVIVHSGDLDNLVVGTAGNDTLNATQGNTTLLGGLGADTFAWSLADLGSADQPYLDIVADFTEGEFTFDGEADRIHLKDLLKDGDTEEDLANYLHFEVVDGDTLVQISSTGGFADGSGHADQTIILQGVSLSGTDDEIIQQLLSSGQLMLDN